MRYRKAFVEGVGFVASILTIALLAGGAVSLLAGAIWPVGVVAAESLALAAALGWIYVSQRAARISEADQKLLDELLNLLSRLSIQRIEEHDFAQPWPRSIMFPVRVFLEEYGDVEHQFDDKVLETTRARLYQVAKIFVDQEGVNAVVHQGDMSQRYVGLTGGEVEGNEELLETFEAKYLAIVGSSRDFLSAHTAFVALAKKRGYDLTALADEGTPHSTVQRLEERDSEWRASTTSGPRAKW
jgi:hypothetical protein